MSHREWGRSSLDLDILFVLQLDGTHGRYLFIELIKIIDEGKKKKMSIEFRLKNRQLPQLMRKLTCYCAMVVKVGNS